MNTAVINCKICSSGASFLTLLGDLSLYVCRKCGLTFIGNTFSSQELADYYDNQGTWYYDNVALNSHTKNTEAIRDLSRLPITSVLDVGCGDGSFLQQLRQLGIRKLCGLELSPVLARAAREKGLEVECKSIEHIDDNFELLTLLDVAEHVQYPSQFFSSCSRALKTKGFIYIHTPRRCFWDEVFIRLVMFAITKKLARVWLNSRLSMAHLQLWSDRALSRAIDKAG